jgi:hypothetical protein
LRNKGQGVFEDMTIASGLGEPIASESAAWGDYNNDGFIDVFVCGEFHKNEAPTGEGQSLSRALSRNLCRLYRNRGDGTFVDVAAGAGVTNGRFAKGAVWGDYDNDGRLDLFVSNLNDTGRLYHNEGNETFRDVTEEAGLVDRNDPHPFSSFPCLFWDYDNDGRLDLLINDWQNNQGEIIARLLGIKANLSSCPRLFRNLGEKGFRNVSAEVGLDSPIAAMSINCGDIDNDGFLDLYWGTGWMSYSGLIPNTMLRNVEGKRFDEVTTSSGTGHLQKGHGVSFADWDCDGDQDLFTVLGGGYPGDQGYSALFQNPGNGKHWLKVKLVGVVTNHAAIGARIELELKAANGTTRSIHRMIGTNGSFGGNTLVEHFGLRDASSVARLTVTWPTSKTTQTFRDLAADQLIVITEKAQEFQTLHQSRLEVPAMDKSSTAQRKPAPIEAAH